MANYTIRDYRGGGAFDGQQELVANNSTIEPWFVKGYTDPRRRSSNMKSYYVYQGDEQDGNVTLRIYVFEKDITGSELRDILRNRPV